VPPLSAEYLNILAQHCVFCLEQDSGDGYIEAFFEEREAEQAGAVMAPTDWDGETIRESTKQSNKRIAAQNGHLYPQRLADCEGAEVTEGEMIERLVELVRQRRMEEAAELCRRLMAPR
jgi:hypothetical protein